MNIRRFRLGDEPALFGIYHSAIRMVACQDYTREQVLAWAPDDLDPELWRSHMREIDPFVVEAGDELVGYADVQASGYIDHFFVSGTHQRRGIGAMLMRRIHEEAAALGIQELTSHVSRTAEPFFARYGFTVAERRHPEIRGVIIPNALMRKALPGTGRAARSLAPQTSPMRLIRPTEDHLASYVTALERAWSADNLRPEAAQEELVRIRADARSFIASLEDREAKGPPFTLPDGSFAKRLPGFRRWLWDGEFCGIIGFRWQEGTPALPPHCLGHIGYSVVPWKQGLGYAKAALAQMLPEAKSIGLPYVEITTDPGNVASQRVILANGGVLVERFIKPPQFGSTPGLRYRIALA